MKLCQLGERVNVRTRAVELAGVQRSNRIAHQPLGGFAQLHERSFGAVGEVCEIGRSLQKYRGGICVASRMSRKASAAVSNWKGKTSHVPGLVLLPRAELARTSD